MMMGNVNSRREAIIQLAVIGEANQQSGIKAVIDKGFSHCLLLSSLL